MITYSISISDTQDFALKKIAKETNRDPQAVIDEQVAYYIKSMLETEAKQMGLNIDTADKQLKDTEKAELVAQVLNAADAAKQKYLGSLA
jgi:predicted transcriptional regulator